MTQKKHTYIERLQELSEARAKLLTEDEHIQMRKRVLGELTKFYRMPSLTHAICALLCIGFVALLLYGSFSSHFEYVSVSVAGLVAVLLMWRMVQTAAAKGARSREDRLSAVNDIVEAHLISDDEAMKLRAEIDELFQTRNEG